MMDRFINVPLIVNPLNWLTIILMVMIGLFAADSIVTFVRGKKADEA